MALKFSDGLACVLNSMAMGLLMSLEMEGLAESVISKTHASLLPIGKDLCKVSCNLCK